MKQDQEISDSSLTVPADSFLLTPDYKKFEAYRKSKEKISEGGEINTHNNMAVLMFMLMESSSVRAGYQNCLGNG